ncbi:ArnT family glycosyltransferase [Allocoleopsis sp.]|uniref:ArnT family glycosyltransferase n=1 Tax=Allocoleopsis sp. TaxID=3088169 RepID=UPI002FD5DE6A
MFIILPFIAGIFLYLILYKPDKGWRVATLDTAIVWGVLVAVITEGLSLLKFITFSGVLSAWLLINLVLCFIFFRFKVKSLANLKLRANFKGEHFYTILLICVACICLTIGLIAIVAPPNNWDSMDYHMPRVVHWIQNHSVEHYPTSYTPQLFSPPWSGFAIMHFQILSSGDRFANLVQWFSMVGSLIGVSLIAEQLGSDLRGQVFSVVVCATIPVGILHATNTKDTYVVAFWLVCFVYYVLVVGKHRTSWSHILKLSASFGLAIFSKGTASIYGLPFFVWLILIDFKWNKLRALKHLIALIFIVITINFSHYIRNYDLFGSPNSTYSYTLTNEAYGIPILISSIIKNASLHLVIPLDYINPAWVENVIYKIHQMLHVDINDPRTTFGSNFTLLSILPNFEDTAGNPIHFWLLVFAIVICLSRHDLRNNKYLVSYVITVGCSFVLFCLLIKWQIWHSRLHLPIFVLASPFIGIVFSKLFHKKIINVIFILLIELSLFYVFFNEFRPIVGEKNIFNTRQIEQYLRPIITQKDAYINTANFVKKTGCQNIGLSLQSIEYPWWVLLKNHNNQQVRLEHVNVKNVSNVKSKVYPFNHFIPCAIISVGSRQSEELAIKEGMYVRAWQPVNSLQNIQVFLKNQ